MIIKKCNEDNKIEDKIYNKKIEMRKEITKI